jgi:hypothetical protein
METTASNKKLRELRRTPVVAHFANLEGETLGMLAAIIVLLVTAFCVLAGPLSGSSSWLATMIKNHSAAINECLIAASKHKSDTALDSERLVARSW